MHQRYLGIVAIGALVAALVVGSAAALPQSAAAGGAASPVRTTPPRPLLLLAPSPRRRALQQQQQQQPPTPLPPSADDVPWSWSSWRTWVSLALTAANAFTAAATGQGGAPIIVAIATGLLLFTVADAAAFSAAVLAAGALPSLAHALTSAHPLFPGQRPLVDWRLIALTTPPMLCGVMLGALANEAFPPWLLSLLMVLLFSGAAADMALSYGRLLRRERERDALLRRLADHVAHEEEEEVQEQEREQQAAAATTTTATAPQPGADDSNNNNKAAAFALGGRRASLESSPSLRSAGTTMAPGELKADLDRLRLLTREIARGEAQSLNPALLGRTLDGELEAAFEEQRRSTAAAAAAAAAARGGHETRLHLQLRRSGGRRSASLDPQHSLGLVLEEEEEEGEESSGGGGGGGLATTPTAAAAAAATTAATTPPETPHSPLRSLAAAAAAAPSDVADAAAANFLARRVVAVKRDHDERVARARAARVQEAALDDARYHAAVDARARSGRRGGALRLESRLADLRSARSASNVFAASAVFGSGRLSRGGTTTAAASSFSTRLGALRGGVGVGSGGSGGVLSFTRGGVDRSGPSAAMSAPSDTGAPRLPSFAAADASAAAAAAGRRPPSFGGGGGASSTMSPFAVFSGGSGTGGGGGRAGSLLGGSGGSGLGPRSAHSDVLSVSPWVLREQQEQREQQQQPPTDEDDRDDATKARGDQQQRPKPPPQLKMQRPPPSSEVADADADDDDRWGRKQARDQGRRRKGDDNDDADDGRVGAFIVEDDDGDGACCACACCPSSSDGCCAWARPLADRAASCWAARSRAARDWYALLPGAEAAVACAAFALFVCYEALEKGLFGNRVCSPGSLSVRLAFVGLMLLVTAATVAGLVSADKKRRRRAREEADEDDGDGDNGKKGSDNNNNNNLLSPPPPPPQLLPPGADLGRHEAAVSWSPALVAAALPLAIAIGAVGGAIGASGVVVSSALLLRLGGHPQVVAASSKITLFTSTAATTLSLALAGRLNYPYALAHGVVTLVATPFGQWCADGLIRRLGRPSLIVATNAARFAAGVAAIIGVSLVPAFVALARGDPSAEFRPVCGAAAGPP